MEGPEWTCDCEGKTDPCAHVAAAAIAAAQAAERGESLASAPAAKPARLVYRLGTKDRLLTVVRVLVHGDGREERLADSIASSVARGRAPEGWTPAHEDLHVERILGTPAREVVQPGRIRDLFAAFANDAEVTLDGGAVRVSGEPVLPHARVEDGARGGFVLRLDRDAAISAVVAKGVVRCGDELHPIGEASTTGELLERLPLERTFKARRGRRSRHHASCPSSSARSTSSSPRAASRAPRPMRVRASRWTSRTRDTPCRCCRRSCTAIPPWRASTATRSSRSATPFRRAVPARSARRCASCATS